MRIEWTFKDGRYVGSAGDMIDATVVECDGRQLATVYLFSRSRHESIEYDDELCSSVAEAKAKAQEIVASALAPFVAAARADGAAAEREACAKEAEKHAFVDRFDGSPRAKHDEAHVIADAIRARQDGD